MMRLLRWDQTRYETSPPSNRSLIPHWDKKKKHEKSERRRVKAGSWKSSLRLSLKYVSFFIFHELNLDANRAVWHFTQQFNEACNQHQQHIPTPKQAVMRESGRKMEQPGHEWACVWFLYLGTFGCFVVVGVWEKSQISKNVYNFKKSWNPKYVK